MFEFYWIFARYKYNIKSNRDGIFNFLNFGCLIFAQLNSSSAQMEITKHDSTKQREIKTRVPNG